MKLSLIALAALVSAPTLAADPILSTTWKTKAYQDFKRSLSEKCRPTSHKVLVDSSQGNRVGQATYLVISNNEKCPYMQHDFKRNALLVEHSWHGEVAEVKVVDTNIQSDLERALGAIAEPRSCAETIRNAVHQAGRLMGFRVSRFDFEISEPSEVEDEEGAKFFEYTTSVFFTNEGYIKGTGATARVRKHNHHPNCSIASLKVST